MMGTLTSTSTDEALMELRLSLSGERLPPDLSGAFRSVGLIRSEYLLRERELFVTVPACQERIASYVAAVASAFASGEVWYRTTELTTVEANTLTGIDHVYHEADFMKGRRGLRRALDDPRALLVELQVVAEVAQDHPNLHVLVPFVRDAADFSFAVALLEEVGWPTRFGTMVEIPSAVDEVPAFVQAGATNLLVGLNDLTALMTGTTREAEDLKCHQSVWRAVARVGAGASGCDWGIAGNLSADVASRAIEVGAPYVSVHYDELHTLIGIPEENLPDRWHVWKTKLRTRSQIAAAETRAALAGFGIEMPL
jgi:phosphoenolpyruvate-protein kinase (PTS system EI component)